MHLFSIHAPMQSSNICLLFVPYNFLTCHNKKGPLKNLWLTLYDHSTEVVLFKAFVWCTLSLAVSIQRRWKYLSRFLHSLSVKAFHYWEAHLHSLVITGPEKSPVNAGFYIPDTLPFTFKLEFFLALKCLIISLPLSYRSFWMETLDFFLYTAFIIIPVL